MIIHIIIIGDFKRKNVIKERTMFVFKFQNVNINLNTGYKNVIK